MGVFERTCELRLVLNTLLRLVSGIDFVLTSIYCLLAFLPYTFFFLIKARPYAWMPWFVRHQATLYSVAASAAVAANWPLSEAGRNASTDFLSARDGCLPQAFTSIHFCESSKPIERPIAGAWQACFPCLPLRCGAKSATDLSNRMILKTDN